ncbi:MAG: protein tyrosine phosphatase [Desulfobacteraceae bacterium 4572_88]|nr:MAG: protein tyrosine phosphatase [Desulfobacteraceae bacterium 4572_88]
MIRYIIFIFIFSHALALAEVRIRPSEWAVPIIGSHLKNIYQVDKDIYRSEQPGHKAFEELSKFGITEVLNLRQYHSDNDETKGVDLKLHRLKLNAGLVSENEIIRALSIIQKRKGPILIHCRHGSDRTGVVIAAYRIIFQQWSKMKASDEMANGGYGYHSTIYPNLIKLIKNLDVSKIRNELGMHVD